MTLVNTDRKCQSQKMHQNSSHLFQYFFLQILLLDVNVVILHSFLINSELDTSLAESKPVVTINHTAERTNIKLHLNTIL